MKFLSQDISTTMFRHEALKKLPKKFLRWKKKQKES